MQCIQTKKTCDYHPGGTNGPSNILKGKTIDFTYKNGIYEPHGQLEEFSATKPLSPIVIHPFMSN